MKYLNILLVIGVLLPLSFGCAVKSDIAEMKQDSVITYSHDTTGQSVTVAVGAPYVYQEFIERKFEKVMVKGYLFKNETESAILVTKMPRGDFEKLVGVTLDAPMTGIKAFPPKTIFEDAFCELVRAYVVTFEKEVVAAVKVKSLNSDNEICDQWVSIDDVMAERPEVVTEFDKSADNVIKIDWK
ncbi:MAG: hypothetical protein OCC46_10250 [Pseudodesulfovibrio sp.]